MTNFDEIVTRREITKRSIAEFLSRSHDPTELFLGKYRVIHTSGSSGEVGYFVYSPEDWARGDALGRRRRQRPSGRNAANRAGSDSPFSAPRMATTRALR